MVFVNADRVVTGVRGGDGAQAFFGVPAADMLEVAAQHHMRAAYVPRLDVYEVTPRPWRHQLLAKE